MKLKSSDKKLMAILVLYSNIKAQFQHISKWLNGLFIDMRYYISRAQHGRFEIQRCACRMGNTLSLGLIVMIRRLIQTEIKTTVQ